MNKQRREQIKKVAQKLDEIKDELNMIYGDEQDYYDNMPENLQGSERGMAAEEAIETLEEAVNSIDEVMETLNYII